MNIIDKLTVFLEEENIIPVSEDNWSILQLNHCFPTDDKMRKELYSFIKEKVGKKSGIYIYMKDGNCLYVGKAKALYDRIKSHYIESFSPVPGDTKDMRWHRFFSLYQGDVDIYWKEFKDEEERQIIEMMLTKILQPVFLKYM